MQNNPTTPAMETRALDLSTPEGAKTRISDLTHDKAFAERYNSGDRAAQAELDQLQRTAYLGEPPPAPATGPMTSEQAKARIEVLTSDREWRKRYFDNAGGPEGRELARLERVAAGMPEVQAEPPKREPGVPETPSSYRFVEPVPEGSEQLAQSYQAAAHAAQLTHGEFTQVHEQALRDEKANVGKSDAEIVDQLDRDLHQIWGKDYARRTELLERYIDDQQREHPEYLALIRDNGLTYNKSLIVTLALKALSKYGMGEA